MDSRKNEIINLILQKKRHIEVLQSDIQWLEEEIALMETSKSEKSNLSTDRTA